MAKLRELAQTRLILIRNAHELKDDPVLLCDHDDHGLSDLGREQAERLRDRFAATNELAGTTRLVASNAPRAIESARILAPVLGDLPVETDCGFCEPHAGECAGMPVEEWLNTLAQDRLANWTPYAPKSPGGESYREAVERAARALIETVLDSEGGTVVIVTHTVPLRASLWAFLSLPFHALYLYPEWTKTGITEWVTDGWLPDGGEIKARLIRCNDHAHLLPHAWSSAGAERSRSLVT